MNKFCDKCQEEIVRGICACGYWFNDDEKPEFVNLLEKSIMAYDFICDQYNTDDPLTCDHHSGNCAIFFKGNYADCEKVKIP